MEKIMEENQQLKKQLVIAMQSSCKTEEIEGSNLLKLLVAGAKRNAGRSKEGLRYFSTLKEFGNIIYSLGGPFLLSLISANLAIPALSSVKRDLHGNVSIHEGLWRFNELKEFLVERKFPLVIWICEDGTRVNGRIQYDVKTNQIVGFVPELDENGVPLQLSFPATSAAVIKSYFDNGVVSSNAYVVMAQPLAENAQAFCLAMWGTDNRFTSPDVLMRWRYIMQGASEVGITVAGFSSDGDPRLLSTMFHCAFQEGSHNWPWFNSSIEFGVPIQDTIHLLVKLRQKLIRPSDIIPMGNYVASRGHLLSLISSVSKDLHKLNMTSINVKDKMNFKSAQDLCDKKVSDLLAESVPGSDGTTCYLDMMREVTSVFHEPSLTPLDRITIIWTWVFFLRFWREFILKNKDYSLGHNFITSNAYICVELNAHGLINIIRRLRDREDHKLFLTALFSSQPCEALFRLLRAMASMGCTIINFSILELQHKLRRVDFLAQSFMNLKDVLVIPKQHKKILSMPVTESSAAVTFLPEDHEITVAVDHALKIAVQKCVKLGILRKQTSVPPRFPLPLTAPSSLPSFDEEEEDDEDDPEVNERAPDDAEILQDVHEDLVIISSGLLGVQSFQNVDLSPNSPFVLVTDGQGNPAIIKKTTLVWLYSSGDTSMSSDRLRRVQEAAANHSTVPVMQCSNSPHKEENISIGQWCAFKSESGKDVSIGRVLAFSYLSGPTWRSQSYSATEAPIKPPKDLKTKRGIGCLCSWYSMKKNGSLTMTKMDVEGYYNIENYICTLPRPTVNGKQIIMPCSRQDIERLRK